PPLNGGRRNARADETRRGAAVWASDAASIAESALGRDSIESRGSAFTFPRTNPTRQPECADCVLPTGQALQSRVVSVSSFCGKTLVESTLPPRLKSSKTRPETGGVTF